MFIHIGNDNVIQSKDVISIIDHSVVTSSGIMEKMMENATKQHTLFGPTDEIKSVVITRENIYYSALSVSTLKKRASMISTISKMDDYSDEIE
ncbi:MAG TPA: extracellular matrix/biofilm biosynthesis regulator RemA family protein [Lentibacillus sp.]|uniref:extracellular matrix regulator RemB n=1 Tax=Lentibacillus sp. TaxID=1925746 RepID=UPI002B4B495B|nr:extracellular matrix/biofilm biosynthesis regulator RemA family protein [Lentibacillus sp.]HLR61195.1 extracellular matrix/biofilm biosynthesis regulator RemA family protein [Lentibacillus sp.]